MCAPSALKSDVHCVGSIFGSVQPNVTLIPYHGDLRSYEHRDYKVGGYE